MSHCRDLSDCSLGMISALSRLTHLNLASCSGVTDTVLSDIASSLYELRHLNVRSCNAISDVGLMHLITLEHLVYLDVSFCSSISDTCVEGLQRHVRAVVRTTERRVPWRETVKHLTFVAQLISTSTFNKIHTRSVMSKSKEIKEK